METKFKNSNVFTSLLWKFMERGGTQGIQFIVQIVLARLLMPEDFGTIAIVMVFISLANVFVQAGFNTALIQKKGADDKDFSSVLFLSLIIAVLLYIFIYFIAEYIAIFYNDPQLTKILKVVSITLFFGAVNSIQNAYVAKHMLFKRLFISSLWSILISGSIGIILAYLGFGIWALVIQQIVNQISITIILWFTVKWRPKMTFSFNRLKSLFSFGSKILVSNLIHVFYMELRTLLIGRIYSPAALGYYNRGETFPKMIVNNIDGSIQSVMFPTFSAYQDNTTRLKEMVRRTVVTTTFLIFPAMIGMAVVAEPLVVVVLTDKWLPAVPFMQVFCITYAMLPIQTVNLQAISALGRSDITLKLQILKKLSGLLILIITIPFGVFAIALGAGLSAFVSMLINIYPNKKLLNYSYKEQFMDIFPSLILALIMGYIIYLFREIEVNSLILLVTQVVSGTIIYIALAKLFKIDSLTYILNILKKLLTRKKV